MTEVRVDPLTRRPVLVCPQTATRPFNHGADGICNLCPGREQHTGIATDAEPATGPWRARSWRNPWPLAHTPAGDGEAFGVHEVVAVNAAHDVRVADLSDPDLESLTALLDRRLAYGATVAANTLLSYSEGPASGRSVLHPHIQLMTFELTPPEIAAEMPQLRNHEACPLCAPAPADLVVAADEDTAAWCPPASRWPFELIVAGRTHQPRPSLRPLAPVLRSALRCYDRVPDGDSLNLVGHFGPVGTDFHAHLHVRMARVPHSGFGLLNSLYVNRSDPRVCAATLRGDR